MTNRIANICCGHVTCQDEVKRVVDARLAAARALADSPHVVPVQTLDDGVENAPVVWPHELRAALD